MIILAADNANEKATEYITNDQPVYPDASHNGKCQNACTRPNKIMAFLFPYFSTKTGNRYPFHPKFSPMGPKNKL